MAHSVQILRYYGISLLGHGISLSMFYTSPIIPCFSSPCRANVLNRAGFSLRGTGRLAEALDARKAELAECLRKPVLFVIHGVLLDISQISLRLGHISQARDFANEAIRIEPMIEDEWSEMRSLLTLADCQLQAGELAAAGTSLVSADRKQWQYGDRLFDDPILATQCAAVLLAHNGHRMVLFRAQQALDRGVCSQWPLGLGAIYLSLALAEQENPAAAKRNLTLAIQFCRRSGAIEYEALTLLSRATDADLAEVNRIADALWHATPAH